MDNKIVDLINYKLEKALRKEGFAVKKDKKKNVKLLIKIKK